MIYSSVRISFFNFFSRKHTSNIRLTNLKMRFINYGTCEYIVDV